MHPSSNVPVLLRACWYRCTGQPCERGRPRWIRRILPDLRSDQSASPRGRRADHDGPRHHCPIHREAGDRVDQPGAIPDCRTVRSGSQLGLCQSPATVEPQVVCGGRAQLRHQLPGGHHTWRADRKGAGEGFRHDVQRSRDHGEQLQHGDAGRNAHDGQGALHRDVRSRALHVLRRRFRSVHRSAMGRQCLPRHLRRLDRGSQLPRRMDRNDEHRGLHLTGRLLDHAVAVGNRCRMDTD